MSQRKIEAWVVGADPHPDLLKTLRSYRGFSSITCVPNHDALAHFAGAPLIFMCPSKTKGLTIRAIRKTIEPVLYSDYAHCEVGPVRCFKLSLLDEVPDKFKGTLLPAALTFYAKHKSEGYTRRFNGLSGPSTWLSRLIAQPALRWSVAGTYVRNIFFLAVMCGAVPWIIAQFT